MLAAYQISLLRFNKFQKKYFNFLIIIMIMFSMSTCYYTEFTTPSFFQLFYKDLKIEEKTSARYSIFLNHTWKYIDQYIPAEEPIAYIAGSDSFIFPYFDNKMKRKIFFLKYYTNPQYTSKILMKNKIRYIHDSLNRVISHPQIIKIMPNLYYFTGLDEEK